jgi:hypothetical protein
MTTDEQGTTPSGTDHEESYELAPKPQWTRPEITSFKPVADAQGISYRIGDGVSNLS